MAIHIHLARGAKPVRDATQPSIGEKVMCSGYPGIIRKVHTGQLSGMVDVKLESGTVTVEYSSIKPVRDAAALKSSFGTAAEHQSKARELKAAGNAEAAKHHERAASVLQQAEQEYKNSNRADEATKQHGIKQLLETAEKHVQAARGATKDSVESVEKEIRTQQRLIDVAKRMGKDVPGTVTQRMKFLQEELEKAKNPRTWDGGSHTEEVEEDRYKDLKVGQKLTWKGKKVEVKGKSISPKKTVNGNMIPEKFTVTFETTDSVKDALTDDQFSAKVREINSLLTDASRKAEALTSQAGGKMEPEDLERGRKNAGNARKLEELIDKARSFAFQIR